MKYEHIIALIVVFQAGRMVLERRARRKKAEAAARAAGGQTLGTDGAARNPAGEPVRGLPEEDEDWTQEHESEWGEHHQDPPSPVPSEERTRGARASQRPGENKPASTGGQAAELGKDLLSQLAKELGLELPMPQRERPPPPAPQSKPSKPPSPAAIPSRPAAEPPVQRPVSAPDSRWVAPEPSEALRMPVTFDAANLLSDADSLRRAMVLKTILEPPLSKRRRGRRTD